MCQYDDRCPVGRHRPGTVCRYNRRQLLRTIGSLLAIGAILTYALPRLDLPILGNVRNLGTDEPEGQVAIVTRVIDGDTITARDATGKNLGRIRILGLDAPELDSRECWATQAHAAATSLLDGKRIRLTSDPKNDDRDTYGRLLRYVDLDHDGQTGDATAHLIKHGHATNTARPRTHTRADDYREAHELAQEHGRGRWGHC